MTIALALSLVALACMFPDQPAHDSADVGLGDSERFCQLRLRLLPEPRANLGNIALCQSPVEHLPLGLPALCQLVGDVVIVRPKEQVCVVDAQRGVAAVQDMDAFGDWANEQLVSDSMRKWPAERAVPSAVCSAAPQDASGCGRLPDVLCEPGCESLRLSPPLLAYSRTKKAVTGQNLAGNGVESELAATQLANADFVLV
jgi:hypothetical protein